MNDIEKQIEGVNDEEGVDMNRLNSNNNDKKNQNSAVKKRKRSKK